MALMTMLAVSAAAQGVIRGKIRDSGGAPGAGVKVEAKNAQTRMVYSAISEQTGDYILTKLPAGKYELNMSGPGFQPYSHAYLTVEDGSIVVEDVDLQPDLAPPASSSGPAPPAVGPSVSAPASRPSLRDFYAEDAEFDLESPMLIVNDRGIAVPENPKIIKGRMVWVYLPGQGRFVLSLAPLKGFAAAGEVGGTTLKFQAGSEQVEVDSNQRILMGSASYNLYVLKQPEWKPPKTGSEPMMGAAESADAPIK